MPLYLIRTVKTLGKGFQSTYFNNNGVFPYVSGEIWENYAHDYVVILDELRGAEISFIVNTIVKAERQLMTGYVWQYVAIFDLGVNGGNALKAPVKVLYMKSTDAVGSGAPQFKIPAQYVFRVTLPYSGGFYGYAIARKYNEGNYNASVAGGAIGVQHPATCSVWERYPVEGYSNKFLYPKSVFSSEYLVTSRGRIAIPNASELIHTRGYRFKYYMRFVVPYITNYYIRPEDSQLGYRDYAPGNFELSTVSVMKSVERQWKRRSFDARTSKYQILGFLERAKAIYLRLENVENYTSFNINFELPSIVEIENFMELSKQLIIQMLRWFPYLGNDIEIDGLIIKGLVFNVNQILIPEFNYKELQRIFNDMLKFFDFCKYIRVLYVKLSHNRLGRFDDQYFYRYYLDGFVKDSYPDTDRYFVKVSLLKREENAEWYALTREIKQNYYVWIEALKDFQRPLVELERLWKVRSYVSSLNKPIGFKPKPKRVRLQNGGVPRRGYGTGGHYSYWLGAVPTQTAVNRNDGKAMGEGTPLPAKPYEKENLFFGDFEFPRYEIEGGDFPQFRSTLVYDPATGNVQPEIVPRKFIIDNTIHPLDPEIADEEAISLLEEMEEAGRKAANYSYSVAKLIYEYYTHTKPPDVVDAAVSLATTAIIGEINPTDRESYKMPFVPITITVDGSIPIDYKGTTVTLGPPTLAPATPGRT